MAQADRSETPTKATEGQRFVLVTLSTIEQWGSVILKVAALVPDIACSVFNEKKIQLAKTFNLVPVPPSKIVLTLDGA